MKPMFRACTWAFTDKPITVQRMAASGMPTVAHAHRKSVIYEVWQHSYAGVFDPNNSIRTTLGPNEFTDSVG